MVRKNPGETFEAIRSSRCSARQAHLTPPRPPSEGRPTRRAGALDAGQRLHACQELTTNFLALGGLEWLASVDCEQRHALWRKSKIDVQQPVEGAQQQAGDEQNHQAEGDLRRHQRARHTRVEGVAATADGRHMPWCRGGRAECWNESEDEGGQATQRRDEDHDAPIEPGVDVHGVLIGREQADEERNGKHGAEHAHESRR